MAEVLINALRGGYQAVSAGSKPAGFVHPQSTKTLKRQGIAAGQSRSKSWDEFEGQQFDYVITVCDQAASENGLVFLGPFTKLPYPAKIKGSEAEIETAFVQTFNMLKTRIEQELP
jgi:arsenate reductase